MTLFSRNLKRFRIAKNLTQEQAAKNTESAAHYVREAEAYHSGRYARWTKPCNTED